MSTTDLRVEIARYLLNGGHERLEAFVDLVEMGLFGLTHKDQMDSMLRAYLEDNDRDFRGVWVQEMLKKYCTTKSFQFTVTIKVHDPLDWVTNGSVKSFVCDAIESAVDAEQRLTTFSSGDVDGLPIERKRK
jgi:hypothetical protein